MKMEIHILDCGQLVYTVGASVQQLNALLFYDIQSISNECVFLDLPQGRILKICWWEVQITVIMARNF